MYVVITTYFADYLLIFLIFNDIVTVNIQSGVL